MKLNFLLKVVALIIFSWSTIIFANAKSDKDLYVFAYCTNLNDSTIYLSQMQSVPEKYLEKEFNSNKALIRQSFADYVIKTYNNSIPATTIVFLEKNQKRIKKRFNKVSNIAVKELNKKVVLIPSDAFSISGLFNKE